MSPESTNLSYHLCELKTEVFKVSTVLTIQKNKKQNNSSCIEI